MAKRTSKTKSHKGLIIFLLILILLLSFTIFTLLFPTTLININGEEIFSAMELKEINEINENIPENGTIFISMHYTESQLTMLLKEELNDQFPVEDAAVAINKDNTIDLSLESLDVQKLFEGQGIPDFLLKILHSRNIHANISINHMGNNKVAFTVNRAYIDDLSIPVELFDSMTAALSTQLEENLNSINGFSIQSIECTDTTLMIDGIIQ